MSKTLTYDKEALIKFINDNIIEVPVLATHLKHKLTLAEPLLIKANELCGISKEQFQEYINGFKKRSSSSYIRDEFMDSIIEHLENQGPFRTHGYEKAGNKYFVFLHKILK